MFLRAATAKFNAFTARSAASAIAPAARRVIRVVAVLVSAHARINHVFAADTTGAQPKDRASLLAAFAALNFAALLGVHHGHSLSASTGQYLKSATADWLFICSISILASASASSLVSK
jgi:hypothetical protein